MTASETATTTTTPQGADWASYDRIIRFLDEGGARYRIIEHPAEGRTDVASALRRHPLREAAKSIIVRVSMSKRTGRYLLAVVPGDRQVDLARLAAVCGGRKAGFATREIAERLAGSVSGSIPPLSFGPELPVVADARLFDTQEVYFNAARLDRSIALTTEDYLSLARPQVEQIAKTAPAATQDGGTHESAA
ncbi:YbaK/EbsC family protein [Streptomyces lincolnensis]|uniref:YbaK/EbsC family protein n=1 Tax=Streptomyces lincolnensis TaxID=1915 RepID=UPI0037D4B400